ncbi:type I polyketide synthase [Actinoplanes sp. NPDC049599]|uniref:type I polyketide synthase n=1 Tax=Actinoplanes sp. NPDC049599 TaxID=3363903 RepID=UPI0037A904F8
MTRDRALDIAVVGVAGRFPGGVDADGLWSAIRAGRVLVARHERAALLAAGIRADLLEDPDYVPVSGYLPDAERFDNEVFRISPRDAEMMDPQYRLMLETAWTALEDAGIPIKAPGHTTSVFASTSGSGYLRTMLSGGPLDPVTLDQALHGTEPDFIASLIAYKLGLTGAAIGVQTACSSGLVGVHLAAQALLSGDCDHAVVVAAGIPFPQGGYVSVPGGVLSPTGMCRPFDAGADGVVPGAGVACVVLSRLGDAVKEGLRPHGVILGSAVNNDGTAKAGYFAPSLTGQERVITSAYRVAEVDAASVGYLETHGTGTRIGDPIEWAAASAALTALGAEPGRIAVGALKATIGHLDSAAGIAGLIKALQVVKRGEIPPVAGFARLNPLLGTDSPLFVPTGRQRWTGPGPRRAGLSSFGIGGTNVHLVVEEPPPPALRSDRPAGPRLIAVSAPDAAGLARSARRLGEHLGANDVALDDVAATLAAGRAEFDARTVVVAETRAQAAAALTAGTEELRTCLAGDDIRPMVFLFPGQGAQRPGMALPFTAAVPGLADHLDRCLSHFDAGLRTRLRTALYDTSTPAPVVADTAVAQPALFALEYALAAGLGDLGLVPSAVAGHSLGEVVAYCVAGLLDLGAAAEFVVARARTMSECPPGAMLTVGCSAADARRLIAESGLPVELAAVNAPELSVVAGPIDAVKSFEAGLDADVWTKPLRASHAFHTSLMDAAVADLAATFRPAGFTGARVPLASGLTGELIHPGGTSDPDALIEQVRAPVRFGDALDRLSRWRGDAIAVELGPGRSLSVLAEIAGMTSVALDADNGAGPLAALGRLWTLGQPVRLAALTAGGSRVHLPGYAFGGDVHVAPEVLRARTDAAPAAAAAPAVTDPPPAPPVAAIDSPRVEAAAIVLEAWRGLLGHQDLDGDADFFALGGNSMHVTVLGRRLREAVGVRVPLRDLLAARTLDAHISLVTGLMSRSAGDVSRR